MLLVIISLKVLSCVKLCCVKKQISLWKSFEGNLIPQNFDSLKKRKEKNIIFFKHLKIIYCFDSIAE